MGGDWQLLAVIISILVAFNGLSLFANRYVVKRAIAADKDKYDALLKDAEKRYTDAEKRYIELTEQAKNYQTIERQILELKADLPISYVRKEDFIRHEVTINAKLDRIYGALSKHDPGGC